MRLLAAITRSTGRCKQYAYHQLLVFVQRIDRASETRTDGEAAAYLSQVESISPYWNGRCKSSAAHPWAIISLISDHHPVGSKGRNRGGGSLLGMDAEIP